MQTRDSRQTKRGEVGQQIGIDWAVAPFDVEQFRMGMEVSWSMACTTLRPMSPTTTR